MTILSCGPNYVFDQTETIDENGWSYLDTLDFQVNILDTLKMYDLFLSINHSTEFSNQNLYINIFTQFPDKNRLKKRVSIDLANKAGQWYGNCNSEDCEYLVPIQQNTYFNQTGIYTFTIEQFTRTNPLPGINKVGLKVLDLGQSRQ